MSIDIDWSKAPEGATHVAKCTDPKFNREFWCADIGDRYKDLKSEAYLRKEDVGRNGWLIYERPTPWTGEGLPPVGIEIEAMLRRNMHDGYAWHRTKVVHGPLPGSEGEVLVFCLETTSPTWVDEFRPVRTPEQIAFEARDNAVKEMLAVWNAGFEGHVKDGLYALYDSNYRKQTAP